MQGMVGAHCAGSYRILSPDTMALGQVQWPKVKRKRAPLRAKLAACTGQEVLAWVMAETAKPWGVEHFGGRQFFEVGFSTERDAIIVKTSPK